MVMVPDESNSSTRTGDHHQHPPHLPRLEYIPMESRGRGEDDDDPRF